MKEQTTKKLNLLEEILKWDQEYLDWFNKIERGEIKVKLADKICDLRKKVIPKQEPKKEKSLIKKTNTKSIFKKLK